MLSFALVKQKSNKNKVTNYNGQNHSFVSVEIKHMQIFFELFAYGLSRHILLLRLQASKDSNILPTFFITMRICYYFDFS